MRATVTVEQIKQAIEQLHKEGVNPTIRGVREHLGNTGSPNRIQPVLAQWREKNPVKMTLNESDAQAISRILGRVRSEAIAQREGELKDQQEQIDELVNVGQRLEEEVYNLKGLLTHTSARMSESMALADERKQHVSQLEAENELLDDRTIKQAQTLAAVRADNKSLEDSNAELRQRLERQAASLDEARQQASAERQSAAVAEAKLDAAVAAETVARDAAMEARQRIRRLEQALEQSQERFDNAQVQHTKLIALHDDQFNAEHRKNAELMCRIDELEDQVLALKAKAKSRQSSKRKT